MSPSFRNSPQNFRVSKNLKKSGRLKPTENFRVTKTHNKYGCLKPTTILGVQNTLKILGVQNPLKYISMSILITNISRCRKPTIVWSCNWMMCPWVSRLKVNRLPEVEITINIIITINTITVIVMVFITIKVTIKSNYIRKSSFIITNKMSISSSPTSLSSLWIFRVKSARRSRNQLCDARLALSCCRWFDDGTDDHHNDDHHHWRLWCWLRQWKL